MKSLEQIKTCFRDKNLKIAASEFGSDGLAVQILRKGVEYRIVASWGMNWDHVSVSMPDRCPTWEEMCWVKKLFWNDNETVIQFHPSEEKYINNHPYVLHLWKPQRHTIPMPPMVCV